MTSRGIFVTFCHISLLIFNYIKCVQFDCQILISHQYIDNHLCRKENRNSNLIKYWWRHHFHFWVKYWSKTCAPMYYPFSPPLISLRGKILGNSEIGWRITSAVRTNVTLEEDPIETKSHFISELQSVEKKLGLRYFT